MNHLPNLAIVCLPHFYVLNFLIDDIDDQHIGSPSELYVYVATLKLMYQLELNGVIIKKDLGVLLFCLFFHTMYSLRNKTNKIDHLHTN